MNRKMTAALVAALGCTAFAGITATASYADWPHDHDYHHGEIRKDHAEIRQDVRQLHHDERHGGNVHADKRALRQDVHDLHHDQWHDSHGWHHY